MANELAPEQVLQQLRTRGYESGGFGTPLRHFKATLSSITGSMVQRGTMPQARLEVNYNFQEGDLEVINSIEPYTLPIAQISMLHSNRAKSSMGVLGASIDKVINADLDENAPQEQVKNQDFLIGKMQEWKMTPGHLMWDAQKGVETERECWEVISVEGISEEPTDIPSSGKAKVTTKTTKAAPKPVSKVTPAQQAINLLDGKTQQQWNNMVFQDPLVKGDGALVSSIINGAFIPSLEDAGLVTKDDNGVYHKVV